MTSPDARARVVELRRRPRHGPDRFSAELVLAPRTVSRVRADTAHPEYDRPSAGHLAEYS